jgi:hypothetical protein
LSLSGAAKAAAQRSSSASSRAASASATASARVSSAGSAALTAAAARSSRVSAAGADAGQGNAVAALAARLAAGCSKDEPWAQLQLARACYSWVVSHVQLPRGCDAELGADVHTWDVGHHLFGEGEEPQLIHQVSAEDSTIAIGTAWQNAYQ